MIYKKHGQCTNTTSSTTKILETKVHAFNKLFVICKKQGGGIKREGWLCKYLWGLIMGGWPAKILYD